jgi:ABC-type polysaccharide/polyol phosphate transport system ATPase subunit
MTAERLAELIDVGKRYVKYDDVPTLVHGLRHLFKRGRRGRLWAVRHVDLEINRGEAIGILGRNGSGKSTTLSMLAGVTAPTEGIVRVNGRIAPLLRLGIGFDQELTGRENVYVNGLILGQTSKEIDGRLDDIIEFSEIEDFIDTPVKFYSSGMTVRLGFASAVAADPDLLIIDEVLAVGDMAFQTKCFDRMLEMRANGATLVVVSHNMQSVQRLADEALVLRDGEVAFRGPTSDAISAYHESLRDARHVIEDADGETAAVEILSVDLYTEDGKLSSNITSGETVVLTMRVRFDSAIDEAIFGIAITSEAGEFVYGENSAAQGRRRFEPGTHTLTITARMPLASGSYMARGGVRWGNKVKHQVTSAAKVFSVVGRNLVRGLVDLQASFRAEQDAVPAPTTPTDTVDQR